MSRTPRVTPGASAGLERGRLTAGPRAGAPGGRPGAGLRPRPDQVGRLSVKRLRASKASQGAGLKGVRASPGRSGGHIKGLRDVVAADKGGTNVAVARAAASQRSRFGGSRASLGHKKRPRGSTGRPLFIVCSDEELYPFVPPFLRQVRDVHKVLPPMVVHFHFHLWSPFSYIQSPGVWTDAHS